MGVRARDQAHRLDYVDGHTRPWLPAPVMAALARYDWPTNIRELRGVAQQLVIMNHDEAVARPQGQLLDLIRQVAPQPAHAPKRPEQQFRRTEKHVLVDVVDVLAPPPDPKTRRPDSFTEAEVRRALAKHKREPTPTARAGRYPSARRPRRYAA